MVKSDGPQNGPFPLLQLAMIARDCQGLPGIARE
jgi:hypothetical protein